MVIGAMNLRVEEDSCPNLLRSPSIGLRRSFRATRREENRSWLAALRVYPKACYVRTRAGSSSQSFKRCRSQVQRMRKLVSGNIEAQAAHHARPDMAFRPDSDDLRGQPVKNLENLANVALRPSKSEAEACFSSIFAWLQQVEEDFGSEREMLLARVFQSSLCGLEAAVAGLREAAEAAMCRAEAAEAACFAPMKQVLEAHLKEYKEQMESEIRRTLHHEVAEATAELKATARELRLLCWGLAAKGGV